MSFTSLFWVLNKEAVRGSSLSSGLGISLASSCSLRLDWHQNVVLESGLTTVSLWEKHRLFFSWIYSLGSHWPRSVSGNYLWFSICLSNLWLEVLHASLGPNPNCQREICQEHLPLKVSLETVVGPVYDWCFEPGSNVFPCFHIWEINPFYFWFPSSNNLQIDMWEIGWLNIIKILYSLYFFLFL